jgi:hypothetical protein
MRDKVRVLGFEVLSAVDMRSSIFWDIKPYCQFRVRLRFEGTFSLQIYHRSKTILLDKIVLDLNSALILKEPQVIRAFIYLNTMKSNMLSGNHKNEPQI